MLRKLPYDQLSDDEFERLVVVICQTILGIGCTPFAKGRDGGKDGWFSGTAAHYPSDKDSWTGTFCIQAKHVARVGASCSDSDFFGHASSVITKEMARMQEVIKTCPFDCYLMFTNRKVVGPKYQEILDEMSRGLNSSNVALLGVEYMDTLLAHETGIIRKFGLHQFAAPERFYEKDIQEIILLFDKSKERIADELDKKSNSSDYVFINKEEKNRLNQLSDEYFDFIKQDSLPYFLDIDGFLKDPAHREYRRKYENTTSDIKAYMVKNHDAFGSFMDLLEAIIEIIADQDNKNLFDCRRLVRTFVHFMYWNCDIGRKV